MITGTEQGVIHDHLQLALWPQAPGAQSASGGELGRYVAGQLLAAKLCVLETIENDHE